MNTGTRLEWCNPAQGEQSPSADMDWVKIFVSPSSPCSGILLQIRPVHFFSVWLKNLPAPQVKLGSINKAIYPSAGWVVISLDFHPKSHGERDRGDLEKASSTSSQLRGRRNRDGIVLPSPLIFNLSLTPRWLYCRLCCSDLGQGSRAVKEETRCLFSTTH